MGGCGQGCELTPTEQFKEAFAPVFSAISQQKQKYGSMNAFIATSEWPTMSNKLTHHTARDRTCMCY